MNSTAPAQDEEGLLSPFLRERRFKAIACYVPAGSLVLDIACGSGQLARYLPTGCEYRGVDRSSAAAAALGDQFLQIDLAQTGAFAEVEKWLPGRPNVIALTAILEHVSDPHKLLAPCANLLAPNGFIVGTTPHPRGRSIHDMFAKIGLCSREAANEHETFLNRDAIAASASNTPMSLLIYKQFLFGLNQVFVFQHKRSSE